MKKFIAILLASICIITASNVALAGPANAFGGAGDQSALTLHWPW